MKTETFSLQTSQVTTNLEAFDARLKAGLGDARLVGERFENPARPGVQKWTRSKKRFHRTGFLFFESGV